MFQGYAAISALLGVVVGVLSFSSVEDYLYNSWCKDERAKAERKFTYTVTAVAWILFIIWMCLPVFISHG